MTSRVALTRQRARDEAGAGQQMRVTVGERERIRTDMLNLRRPRASAKRC